MGAVLPDGISSQKINRLIDWFLTAQLPMSTCHQNLYSSEDDYSPLPPSRYVWIDKIWLFSFVIFAFNCYYIVFVCLLFVDSWQRCKPFPWQRRSFNRRPVAKVCSFFFLVLNNSLILLKRNLLLFATVGNITLLSLCVELSFLYEKMIICKSYVAGNILCEFHTCFLPEDRICVNREHVIWILLNFQKE